MFVAGNDPVRALHCAGCSNGRACPSVFQPARGGAPVAGDGVAILTGFLPHDQEIPAVGNARNTSKVAPPTVFQLACVVAAIEREGIPVIALLSFAHLDNAIATATGAVVGLIDAISGAAIAIQNVPVIALLVAPPHTIAAIRRTDAWFVGTDSA